MDRIIISLLNKVPGIDGVSPRMMKEAWKTVGTEIYDFLSSEAFGNTPCISIWMEGAEISRDIYGSSKSLLLLRNDRS